MNNVRHILGISGGKDSAALAIYMKQKYPDLDIDYYTCDTGKELEETYLLIEKLNSVLGKEIRNLQAADGSNLPAFDHFLSLYRGYLPSSQARWCTKKLKLEPFEKYVGDNPVISYVGIRGDENREGYISKKSNIQSIFPFRKNIWSEDVIAKVLSNSNRENLINYYSICFEDRQDYQFLKYLQDAISPSFNRDEKLRLLLNNNVKVFNKLVYEYLKSTDYPLAYVEYFPLIENDEVLVREDIFNILDRSGVGVPAYYNKIEFEINGNKSHYSRSRSGCYFCFFQQKIEWVWLYEQHPEKYKLAMEYEKDGYSWNQNETLQELIKPERITKIKEDYIKRSSRVFKSDSPYLLDILDDSEDEGCAACFI